MAYQQHDKLRASDDDGEDVEGLSLLGEASKYSQPLTMQIPRRESWLVFLSYFLNLLFLLILFLIFLRKPENGLGCRQPAVFSPADESVEYHDVVFNKAFGDNKSPYQGWPDDKKDKLWEDMYSMGVALHVDSSAASKLPNSTAHAPVPGYEQEYLIGLDVFHQIHCLNMIRRAFYPRRYNQRMIRDDGSVVFWSWMHVDHCIESIRQSLVCNADTSVVTYEWIPTELLQPQIGVVHSCKNFDKIHDWAWDRALNWTNMKSHVVDGKIVTSSGSVPGPADESAEPDPEGWHFTVDDM